MFVGAIVYTVFPRVVLLSARGSSLLVRLCCCGLVLTAFLNDSVGTGILCACVSAPVPGCISRHRRCLPENLCPVRSLFELTVFLPAGGRIVFLTECTYSVPDHLYPDRVPGACICKVSAVRPCLVLESTAMEYRMFSKR